MPDAAAGSLFARVLSILPRARDYPKGEAHGAHFVYRHSLL